MVVVMYSAGTLHVVAVCDGPTSAGFCPRVTLADEAPCSGLEIVLSKDESSPSCKGLTRPRLTVPHRTANCPLAELAGTYVRPTTVPAR